MSDIDHQLRVIKRGCDELIVEAELRESSNPDGPCASSSAWTRLRPTCISDTRW